MKKEKLKFPYRNVWLLPDVKAKLLNTQNRMYRIPEFWQSGENAVNYDNPRHSDVVDKALEALNEEIDAFNKAAK
jgi:hypothetical protein